MPFHELIGKFASTIQLKNKLPSRRSPHRLLDDLHWKCPACKSCVTTRDTEFHVIGCLLSIVEPMSRFNPSSRISAFMNSIDIKGSVLIDRDDRRAVPTIRPQTRVVRPTPNIRHPVISIEDCREAVKITKRKIKAPDAKDQLKSNASILTLNRKKNPQKAVQSSLLTTTQATRDVSPRISLGNQKLNDAQQNNPKRKYKTTIEQKTGTGMTGVTDCLRDEMHAMSLLMAKELKKQSSSSDKKTKVQRAHFSGCDPAGWDHFKSKLTACSKCNRSFFPYRVAAHEKVCTEYRPLPPQQVPSPPRSKEPAKSQYKP